MPLGDIGDACTELLFESANMMEMTRQDMTISFSNDCWI